jgi:RNA polymerase sigma factor (TIGR02999 family)
MMFWAIERRYLIPRQNMSDVTRILNAIKQGDDRAADKLLPLVYEELRLLAAQKMSQERPGQTLQATALVHEAYIRLVEAKAQSWNSRGHFFKAAAEAMRRILVENARRKKRIKRGGDRHRVELDEVDLTISEPSFDLLVLDESLERLEKEEEVIANLVKLRFYAGLTLDQAAKILKVSRRTAIRYWVYAQAWLYKEVGKD